MRFSIWFFLITTFSIFCITIVPADSQCLDHQKTLLLQLKDNLEFNYRFSTKLRFWNHNSDCCEWGGVTCDNMGHVVGLDLSNEFISGGIHNSSSLFSLKYLQSLNLANNIFSSWHISSGFEKLTNLTYLNLSHANLRGQFPIEISLLTRLVSLDFSWNYDLKLGNSNLKLLVQNLTKITELRLDGVNISSMGEEWCQAISSSLPNLQVLSLSRCHLSGPLCSSLENLRSLSVINLSENNLSAPVPNFVANFTNLTELYLKDSNLHGTFPESIFHVPTLRTLDVGVNELLQGYLPEFSQHGSLQTMILRYTNFSGTLPDSIGNLRMLSMIDVFNCSFTGPIPSSLANLTQLVHLDLAYNMFIGPIPSFSKNLSYIYLSHNSLSGTIPSSLLDLPSLKEIYLSFNKFDGQVGEISNASSSLLEILNLRNNNLQGSVPMSFFELGRLTDLVINSNNFSGLLQLENFYRLHNLSFLDLSYNSLSIHTTSGSSSNFTFIPQFEGLYLASCKLQSFPDLKNQSMLAELDLSDNQLEGEIPNWIWEVSNGGLLVSNGGLTYLNFSHNLFSGLQEPYVSHTYLAAFDIHSNQFHGEIPIPGVLAEFMDFSSNSFSSSIPTMIGSFLTNSYFFSLSNNSIIGNIPQSICNMEYLQVLDLSNNRLNGTVPSCLIKRSSTSLGVLNLRNNRLSGKVLSMFPKNCSLQTLDLSGNNLDGQVPKSLSNCRGMEVLNLGKNILSGRFPCFLENISSLHVLVLRSNRFHGDINCQGKNNESWWNLQIIDLAFNNFGGNLPSSYFSNWKAMVIDNDNVQPKLDHLGYEFGDGSGYYSSRVNVIYKAKEVEWVKILAIFTCIDFSSNIFDGKIPDTVGNLKALVLLNLSHNALNGSIPASLENLKQLESLDLSQNMLTGMIPTQLASLTFLSLLNVSYNLLFGKIPTGSQFQTFSETSFVGNPGLCGFPLNTSCNNIAGDSPPPIFGDGHSILETEVYLSAALGFIVGLGIIIWPLVFCRRWRQWYYKHVDQVFLRRIIQRGAYRNPIRMLSG
ncbi:receptor-like protein 7 [Cornus florida]|uniref:receptor-like protein 7 n=1 Tax=Cornus florida TaxID=4283 RepID=UPI002899EACD|nr:receptor-like protein 7 [Cornus florida]